MSREDPTSSGRHLLSERWIELVDAVDAAAEAREADPSHPGVQLGRFELLEWLGGGGMGVVFRARDSKLNREVALKLWKLPRGEAEAAVLHEAQCLAKLSHPNVVAMYETGKVGEDVFLTMEFVEGMDGRQWASSFLLSWEQILDFYIAAGRGLAAAHAAGLEHGDFKPDNVLLGRDQRVRVADFGVARSLREHVTAEGGPLSVEDSAGLGTLGYMAPERLQGRRGDARSDQFSYCVAMWECLYGARPFEGVTPLALLEAMESGQRDVGEAVPGVPRRLRAAIERGLAVAPARRWPDMGSLLAELGKIRRRPKRRQRGRRFAAAVVGVAVGSSLATAAVVARRDGGIKPQRAATLPMRGEEPPQPQAARRAESAPAGLVGEVVAEIEAGDLEGGLRLWEVAQNSAWESGTPIDFESVEIARAFLAVALAVEHADHERAATAARYANRVAAYASTQLPGELEVHAELAEMAQEFARLTSRETRALGVYTRESNDLVGGLCECPAALGFTNSDDCRVALGFIGRETHSCLRDVLADHREPMLEFLDCARASVDARQGCMENLAGCDPEVLRSCHVARKDALSECLFSSQVREQLQACGG